jgi:uncharacterized protein
MRKIIVGLISLYQLLISPLLGQRCRFHPTCSEFAKEAIAVYGVIRGAWLSAGRLARCHPWHEGGFDPVPRKH